MSQQRRTRHDSVSTEADMAQAELPDPPQSVLKAGAAEHWYSIVRARARSAWTNVDLGHAANLAKWMADVDRIDEELREEGYTLTNQRGTPVMNPKHSVLEQLSRRIAAYSRLLHVHPEATDSKAPKAASRNEKQREVDAQQQAASEEEGALIPGATKH